MYAKIVLLEKRWKKLAKESHTVKRCVYFWWKRCVCGVFVFVCVCSAGDWWLLSMQAYICEWIGVTAHEQTQGGRLWNSLQRIARVFTTTYTHQGEILTHFLSLHTNTHTPHLQIHFQLQCLKIYLPAAASRRERWALLVLWSPPTRPPWRLQVSSSTNLSLNLSPIQAICFLYCQPVSLYYAL